MSDARHGFVGMSDRDLRRALRRCCGASRWVAGMMAERPFDGGVVQVAREVWGRMRREDILEAFDHHPRIGASVQSLREKFAPTADLSASEQAGVSGAGEATIRQLRDANVAYERRFGHIFIVCASGKSASEMLALLQARMQNDPDAELTIAAAEQMKITELRLRRELAAVASEQDTFEADREGERP